MQKKIFSADSLDNGQILKKFENNPWIRITVLNYTVIETHALTILSHIILASAGVSCLCLHTLWCW